MAYDEELAERVRRTLGDRSGLSERKMFGGLAFLLDGHMFCGVTDRRLMVRLGSAGAEAALDEPHTQPMDFTGRPMKTMVYVTAEGVKSDGALRAWVERAAYFASTLPPKR